MTLPLGAQMQDAGLKTDNAALEAAIEKAMPEITEAQTASLKKRKRKSTGKPVGRPPKNKPEAAAQSVDPAASGDPSMVAPQVDLTPVFGEIVKFPFGIAATKTRCADVALKSDEAEGPAQLANQLFNLYAPEIAAQDPKKVVAFSLGLSFVMLAINKAQVYAEFKLQTLDAELSGAPVTDRLQRMEFGNPPPPRDQAGPIPPPPFARQGSPYSAPVPN